MKSTLVVAILIIIVVKSVTARTENGNDRADAVASSISGMLSKGSITDSQNALLGSGTLSSLNGTGSFGGQISCGSDIKYLNVSGNFSASGLSVQLQADTDLDGSLESTKTFTGIHGLCSNGFVRCMYPDSFEGCTYYKWQAYPMNGIQMVSESQIQTIYNCTCIHNSCDPNSSTKLEQHLQKVGSGMVNSFGKFNPYFAVSDVKQTGAEFEFYGRLATSCASAPDASLQTYFESPHTLTPDASIEEQSNHYYSVVSNSAAAQDFSVTEQTCSIVRDVDLTSVAPSAPAPEHITREDIFTVSDSKRVYILDNAEYIPGLTRIYLGVDGDGEGAGLSTELGCEYFSTFVDLNLIRPEYIKKAVVKSIHYEDLYHLDINETTISNSVGEWTKYDPVPENCNVRWTTETVDVGEGIDITSHFQTPGQKKITMSTAVGQTGWMAAVIDIYDDRYREEDVIEVYGYAQGRNYMDVSYDLKNGTGVIVSDGIEDHISIRGTINYDDICLTGTETIEQKSALSNAFDIFGSYVSGEIDTSVDIIHTTSPTCENGLKGSFRVEDQQIGDDYTHIYLFYGVRFEMSVTDCLYQSNIVNTCEVLDLSLCTTKDHIVDGVPIITNFTPTGNKITPKTQDYTIGDCKKSITEDFFHQTYSFECQPSNPEYDRDISHLKLPTFTDTEMTITVDSDDPENGEMTIPIPEMPKDMGCALECRVSRSKNRSQFNVTGVETQERNTDETTEIFTRACEIDVCPLEAGETIVEPCGCLNQFAQVAAALEVMRLASKDMVCVE